MASQWLYVLHQQESNLFKVGITKSQPQNRLRACQTGNPFPLRLSFAWLYQDESVAANIEKMFIDGRAELGIAATGEWFGRKEQEQSVESRESWTAFILSHLTFNRYPVDSIIDWINVAPLRAKDHQLTQEMVAQWHSNNWGLKPVGESNEV